MAFKMSPPTKARSMIERRLLGAGAVVFPGAGAALTVEGAAALGVAVEVMVHPSRGRLGSSCAASTPRQTVPAGAGFGSATVIVREPSAAGSETFASSGK